MKRWMLFCSALLLAATLAGCAKTARDDGPPVSEPVPRDTESQSGIDTRPLPGARELTPEERARQEREALLRDRIVYFDYDRSELRPDAVAQVNAHAQHLVRNRDKAVRLEGHADERGSREYNIALGERRSQAVRRALMLQGVTGDQISTVSFGEERPVAFGHDEESWAANRRVEIVYVR